MQKNENNEQEWFELADKAEQKRQIDLILDNALPERRPFIIQVLEMYRNVGFRNLFRDRLEIGFILLLAALLFWYSGTQVYESAENINGIILFTLTPLCYFVLASFSFVSARYQATYETQMACRYNFFQLSALRMLVFSAICTVGSGGVAAAYAALSGGDFAVLFLLSLCALFLFSALFLALFLRLRSRWATLALPCLWLLGNALFSLHPKAYEHFLLAVPPVVYLLAAAVSLCLYGKNLKRLLLFHGLQGMPQ